MQINCHHNINTKEHKHQRRYTDEHEPKAVNSFMLKTCFRLQTVASSISER